MTPIAIKPYFIDVMNDNTNPKTNEIIPNNPANSLYKSGILFKDKMANDII